MRISDWSSDVCSSDLVVCAAVAASDGWVCGNRLNRVGFFRQEPWESCEPPHFQHQCKLTHRYREQALLPQRICGERRIHERSRLMWEQGLHAKNGRDQAGT